MPINNNLKPIKKPFQINLDQKTEIEYLNDLENIKIILIDHTPWPQIIQYVSKYSSNVSHSIDSNFVNTFAQTADALEAAFTTNTIPSILDTIRLTFRIEGISVQDALNLTRNHTFSFSAHCSNDYFAPDFKAVVPEAIENSPEFYKRYKQLTQSCYQLYTEMVESNEISLLDARLILNKNHDNLYHASCNFKDFLEFVKQNIDRQTQTKSNNIIAYQMWLAVCQQYPIAHLNLIDFEQPSQHYIKNARKDYSINLYFPEPNSDTFEWNEEDFIYQAHRENLNGTNPSDEDTIFETLLKEYQGDLVFFSETATDHIEMIRKGEIFNTEPRKDQDNLNS